MWLEKSGHRIEKGGHVDRKKWSSDRKKVVVCIEKVVICIEKSGHWIEKNGHVDRKMWLTYHICLNQSTEPLSALLRRRPLSTTAAHFVRLHLTIWGGGGREGCQALVRCSYWPVEPDLGGGSGGRPHPGRGGVCAVSRLCRLGRRREAQYPLRLCGCG